MEISQLVSRLKPSATIAAAAKARELRSSGINVREFTLGEPDFTTPAHICDSAVKAMQDGHTHYTPATGLPALKEAVCTAFERDYGVTWKPSEVAVSNGAKHALHNALTVLCNPGDEVIIPTPYWVSYSALVELCGAVPVLVETTQEENFCLSPEKLRKAVTPRTRLLLLNSPSNPTGMLYGADQLQALGDVIIEENLVVISDEIYDKLIYPGSEFRTLASFGDELRSRTVIVNGVSKAYAMTGWRIGWTLAPENVTAAINRLQSQQTSNPCSISQHAAIAALTGPQECLSEMMTQFTSRREFVLERLRAIPGLSFAEPGGAFYAFFRVSDYFGKPLPSGAVVNNSTEFCEALLTTAHVALVTGDAFGAPGYVRLSFATSVEILEAGLAGLAGFLEG